MPEYRDKLGTLNPGGRNGVIFNILSPDNSMRVQMVQLPGDSDRPDTETRIYKQGQDLPVMVYRSIPVNDFASNEVIFWAKDSSHFIILARQYYEIYDLTHSPHEYNSRSSYCKTSYLKKDNCDSYSERYYENNSYTIDSLHDVRSNQLLWGGCGESPLTTIYEGDPEPRDKDLNPRYCTSPKKPPQPLLTREDIKKMEWVNPVESLLE